MIGGAKGIGIGIDFGIPNQYCRATSKPYIEKDVLDSLRVVSSAYGKSNNDADRSIVKNLVDPDNPFVISNAAFKLNSGFGKYEADFTNWVAETGTKLTSDKITNSNPTKNWIAYRSSGVEFKEMHIRILGIPDNGILYFQRPATDGGPIRMFNGDNNTPAFTSTGVCGFFINNLTGLGWSNLVIEQIPSFEGAFVTDGIDDLITSTKTVQEMLGGSNEITVVSMIHQIHGNVSYTNGYTNYIRHSGGFIRNSVTGIDGKGLNKTGIYGYTATNLNSSSENLGNVINNILGDKKDYTFERNSTYTLDDAKYSVQNFINANNQPSNEGSSVAWYWTVIANKVLTTDQINQVIAYYNLDRCVEPTVWYDVQKQGLSNETPAADWYLKDFSKNGFDMSLFNFAKKGNSGVGKYEVDFTSWKKSHFTDEVNTSSSKIEITGTLTTNSILINTSSTPIYNVEIYTPNKSLTVYFQYNDGTRTKRVPLVEGINELPSANDSIFVTSDLLNSEGITITQIPSHAGALCLDGVNDYGQFVGNLGLKDYTIAVDRAYDRIVAEQVPFIASISTNGQAPFLMEYLNSDNSVYPHSFGATTKTTNLNIQRQISYQSTYVYNGNTISKGTSIDTGNGLTIGNSGNTGAQYAPLCLWSLLLFPYSLSEFLIERQLKKRKAGTLYPDMVEFRPVVTINTEEHGVIEYADANWKTVKPGDWLAVGSLVTILLYKKDIEEVVNATSTDVEIQPNIGWDERYNHWNIKFNLTNKSPQKIDITIDEYIRFEDIVQPYPAILSIPKPGGGNYTFGEKIPVGYKFNRSPLTNLLGEFYSITGFWLNDILILSGEEITVSKTMVCRTRATWIATNTNAPKCILSPSRLRIPNSSYKILGYIPDLSGNGNHGKINNSAYAGMSGANGYNENFTTWAKYPKVNVTDSRITLNGTTYNEYWIIYQRAPHKSFKVNISGIPTGGKLVYRNNQGNEVILSNGINTIPSVENTEYNVGFAIQDNSASLNWSNLVIEQIGEYEGAYCLDGVDDFISIPTTVGGKQVLMKVNQSNIDSCLYTQVEAGIGQDRITTALPNSLAYQGRWEIPNWSKVYIDAIENNYITNEQLYNITHIITAVSSNSVKTTTPIIGALRVGNSLSTFAQMSLYDFMLFDEISTDEEIATLNEYIGIEPKVTVPPYYWDAYGKANNNADDIEGTRHALWNKANLTDAGEALICNNIGYDEMSGYGGYSFKSFDTTSRWNVYPSSGEVAAIEIISRNGYSITLKKKLEDIYSWQFNYGSTVTNLSEDLKFNVKCDKPIKVIWQFKYRLVAGESYRTETISTDDLTANVEANLTLLHKTPAQLEEMGVIQHYYLIYFNNAKLAIDEEYTITMLPLYPNGLCLDGIDDYLFNANIPALTDFTVIAKREWFNKSKYLNECFAHKGIISTPIRETAFMLEYEIGNDTYYRSSSYGGYINVERSNRPEKIVYQTPTSYNGSSITIGSGIDTTGLTIGAVTNNYWKGVFYKAILYPKTITNLEIMFLKNMFEKDEIIDLTNPIFIQE